MARRRRKSPVSLLLGMVLVASILGFVLHATLYLELGFPDFGIFMSQASEFLRSGKLYSGLSYGPSDAVFKYPPPLMLALVPLAALESPTTVTYGHWGVQILIYFASAALGIHVFRLSRDRVFTCMAVVVALNFTPFFETLFGLQIETYILFLTCATLYCFRRDKEFAAGIALGIAAAIKLYPGFLFLYFALKGRWVALAGGITAAGVLGVLSLLAFGWAANYDYYGIILPLLLTENPLAAPHNIALSGHLQTLFAENPKISTRLGQGFGIALVALTILAIYRNRRATACERGKLLEFSLFIPLALLLLTNSWANYQLLLLVPLYGCLAHALFVPRQRFATLTVTALAFVLLSVSENYLLLDFYGEVVPRAVHDRAIYFRTASTLILWGTLWCIVMGRTKRENNPEIVSSSSNPSGDPNQGRADRDSPAVAASP